MDESSFIIAAYIFAGLAIALLCLTTALRARAVRRALGDRGES